MNTNKHILWRGPLLGVTALLIAASLSACTSETAPAADDTNQSTAQVSAAASKAEGNGFDTPEEAVQAYLHALQAGDFNQMMRVFAIESYVENYDFEAILKRTSVFNSNFTLRYPNDNALTTALNVESRRADVTRSINNQSFMLFGFDYTNPIVLQDDADIQEFKTNYSASLDIEKFASLNILGFIAPEDLSDIYATDTNQENLKKESLCFGAEMHVSRAVVIEIDGEMFLMCPDLYAYDNKWYFSNLQGNLANLFNIDAQNVGTLYIPAESRSEITELIQDS